MSLRVLSQSLIEDASFWKGKNALLPAYDRTRLPVTSVSFSAGRMAYGHTGDILQDLLDKKLEADEAFLAKKLEQLKRDPSQAVPFDDAMARFEEKHRAEREASRP